MITKEQQIWLDHLSDTDKISIIPYNPETKRVFKRIKNDLIKVLGKTRISHRGSTNLKISGQGEIDLYIPTAKKQFNIQLEKLINYLGEPGSLYPLKRVRFFRYIDDIKIELFLINKNDSGWKESVVFEKYLKHNRKALLEYEKIKLECNGCSVREYYTKKTAFINKILLFSKNMVN